MADSETERKEAAPSAWTAFVGRPVVAFCIKMLQIIAAIWIACFIVATLLSAGTWAVSVTMATGFDDAELAIHALKMLGYVALGCAALYLLWRAGPKGPGPETADGDGQADDVPN